MRSVSPGCTSNSAPLPIPQGSRPTCAACLTTCASRWRTSGAWGLPRATWSSQLLAWLSAGHFTFLGYRAYAQAGEGRELKPVPGTGLGILRHDGVDESCVVSPADGDQGKHR